VYEKYFSIWISYHFLPKRHKKLAKSFDLIIETRQKLTKNDF